jgi:hypothetical protein
LTVARLPAIVAKYADFDGRDLAAIKHIARTIREAGLIPTTKRGSGASPMSDREVANLLLAANGADSPAEAARAVLRLRGLRRVPAPIVQFGARASDDRGAFGDRACDRQPDACWRELAAIGNLGAALGYIIRNAAAIESAIVAELGRGADRSSTAGDWRRRVSATLTIGYACASFEVAADPAYPYFRGVRLDYRRAGYEKRAAEFPPENSYRQRLVRLDFAVILALSRLVGCDDDPDAKTSATAEKRRA